MAGLIHDVKYLNEGEKKDKSVDRTEPFSRKKKMRYLKLPIEYMALPLGLAAFIGLWALVCKIGEYPTFILPDPLTVFRKIVEITIDGTLFYHARATLLQILLGLSLGLVTATVLGYVLAKQPFLERLAGPYIVASQSIPAVALGPLIIIWFGSGILSKVLICALVVFFPILINTIVGIRSVDPGLQTVMRSLGANRWQNFVMLEVPAALPVLLGGLKIGVTLSVIGAVVGEFVGADRGLGYLVNLAKGLFNTPLMFASLISLAVISMVLYLTVAGLERVLLSWKN
jgi:NitT/TauT family transport system permease protein